MPLYTLSALPYHALPLLAQVTIIMSKSTRAQIRGTEDVDSCLLRYQFLSYNGLHVLLIYIYIYIYIDTYREIIFFITLKNKVCHHRHTHTHTHAHTVIITNQHVIIKYHHVIITYHHVIITYQHVIITWLLTWPSSPANRCNSTVLLSLHFPEYVPWGGHSSTSSKSCLRMPWPYTWVIACFNATCRARMFLCIHTIYVTPIQHVHDSGFENMHQQMACTSNLWAQLALAYSLQQIFAQ
jgi:hypothetical protein